MGDEDGAGDVGDGAGKAAGERVGEVEGGVPAGREDRVRQLLALNDEIEALRRSPRAAVHAPLATVVTLVGGVLMASSALRLVTLPGKGPWIVLMAVFTAITAVVLGWMGVDLLAAQLAHRRRIRGLEDRLRTEEERLARLRDDGELSPPPPLP